MGEEFGRMCSDIESLMALEKLPASTRVAEALAYNSAVRKVQNYLPKNPEDFLGFVIDFYKYLEEQRLEDVSSVNQYHFDWKTEVVRQSEGSLRHLEDLATALRSIVKEAKKIPK